MVAGLLWVIIKESGFAAENRCGERCILHCAAHDETVNRVGRNGGSFDDVEKTATAKTNAGFPIQLRSSGMTKKFERVVRTRNQHKSKASDVSCRRSEMVSRSHCADVP
jgi:hypothetical protein